MTRSQEADLPAAKLARLRLVCARAGGIAPFLIQLELPVVAALTAVSMLSERLLLPALLLAALFWPVRLLASGRLSIRTPVDLPVFCLALMAPVTLWATAWPGITYPQVYRLLLGIALFYAVVNWGSSPLRLRWLAAGFVLTGVGLSAFSLVSVEWLTGKLAFIPTGLYARFATQVADSVHPNVMAGSLALLLSFTLGLVLFAWTEIGGWQRTGLLAAAVVVAAVIVLTQSRGAWLALSFVLLLLLVMRWRRGWWVALAAVLAAGAGSYFESARNFLEALSTSGAVNGVAGRLEIWSRAVEMIRDFPFTGVGMGSFGRVSDLFYPFVTAEPGSIPHAHNLYLQVAVDLGLPGLAAWLVIFGLVLHMAWRLYSRGRGGADTWAAALGAGLLAAGTALAVHGVVDAVTWGMVRPAPLVWAVWGLAAAGCQVYRPLWKSS